MKCPNCGELFKLIHMQVVQSMDGKHESNQIHCPRCNVLIRNYPITVSTKTSEVEE